MSVPKHEDPDLMFNGGVSLVLDKRELNFNVWIDRLKKLDGPYSKIAEWAVEAVWEQESAVRQIEINDEEVARIKSLVWTRYMGFAIVGNVTA